MFRWAEEIARIGRPRRYGYADLADKLAADTFGLVETQGFHEYYDPRDGSACGAADFSWSAALALELAS